MVKLSDASAATPSPSLAWQRMSDIERGTLVISALRNRPDISEGNLVVTAAKHDGQIIVSLAKSVTASKRGTLLLDLEKFLKEQIDPSLVVWVEPLGDRNSLRNLRGIEVKA